MMNVQHLGAPPAQPASTALPTSAAALPLAEGALLKATVQRVTDEMVLLNINGRLLSARTEIPLQARQEVLLEVTKASPLQVALRPLPQTAPGGGSPAPALHNLPTLLTGWGVNPDDANLTIARTLFQQTHTLNPADIQTVRSLWHSQGNNQPANLPALVYLHTQQLPVNTESLAMARHWLNTPLANGAAIAQNLAGLQQSMNQALAHLQNAAGQNPATAHLAAAMETALTQMAGWSVSADTPAAEIMARLSALIPRLGTPPEADLHALMARPQPNAPAPAGADSGQPARPALVITADGTVLNLAAPAKAPQARPVLPHAALPDSGPADLNPLHRLAGVVKEALAQAGPDDAPAPTMQALREVAGRLDTLTKDLAAVQLSNLAQTPHPAAEPYYLFPIPLHTANGPRTAHLKVFHRDGQREVDPDNVRLALLLDLPELGEVAINISVLEKRLSGQILSGREHTHQRVAEELAELRHNLGNLGYWVDSLTADRLTAQPQPAKTAPAPAALPLTRLNVKA
jgi:hypothetical protein